MDYLDDIDFNEEEPRSSWIAAAVINGLSTGMNLAFSLAASFTYWGKI